LAQGGVYLALALVMVAAGLISPGFFTQDNLLNILRQAAALGIIGVGQAIVMIGGGFDLSVTAVMQLTTVMMAELSLGRDDRLWPAAVACLALGLLIGWINGWITTRRLAPSFMVTLATAVAVTGARLLYTGGTPSGLLPDGIRPLSQGEVLGIPVAVLLCFGLTAIGSIILRRTVFGRELYALGSNREAARLSGVRVQRVGTLTFVISGVLAAFAGLVLAAYVGYADPWLGGGYDLDSIAAAAIGGVSLAGGRGGLWGTLAGVLLIRMLMNFVLVVHLPVEFQYVVRGSALILAVALYSAAGRRSA
jgi:ribose/xylose/arabinose/galactoside ABC-type transport system permease subunit